MKIRQSYHLGLIMLLFALISVFHYIEQISIIDTAEPSYHFGLTRHAIDRILYLLPIIYCGLVFGLVAGLVISCAAFLVMLPRAIFISPAVGDAVLESIGVLIVGALVCYAVWARAKGKEELQVTLTELESAYQLLQHYVRTARSNEKRLTTLNAISSVVTESLELRNILNRSVHSIVELMEVEVVLVYSLDEGTQELVLLAYEGVSEEFAQAVDRMKVGEGFNGGVAMTGKPAVVEDASADPRLSRPVVRKMKIQGQLIVPMILRNRVRGTLCVAMRRPRRFLPAEAEVLSAVATQIATAIENARLYEKERLTAERLAISERNYRGLFEGANDAIWVHDLAGKVIAANKATEKLTGYTLEELTRMDVRAFLSDEGLNLASQIRSKLFQNEPVAQPYEQHLLRKDGTEAALMLTTSLVTENGTPTAFQHIARDVTEEKRMQENLHYYLSRITNVQEEERKRIARELHDDAAQALYALSRQVDNFTRSNTNLPENCDALLKDLSGRVTEILKGVRRFSQDLRPPMIDDLGLLPAVRWLVSEMEQLIEIEIGFTISGDERRFPLEVELTLFRAIQEALRNVWKHADASKAEVAIAFNDGSVRVTVSDNGGGFEPSEKIESLARMGKLGLVGIEERMRLLGGSLKVKSALGKGTTLIAEAPI